MNDKQNDKAFVIRKKHYLLLFSVFIFELLFSYLALIYTELFLIPALILFFSYGFWAQNIKCPRCKKPIYLNPLPFESIGEVFVWTPWLPANCSECGLDFE
jgi:hypothetical protein